MLDRIYQFAGVALLSGYAWTAFTGHEFGSPMLAREVPPVNAVVGSTKGTWGGRSATYYYSSHSGTRSGWGGGGFGGK